MFFNFNFNFRTLEEFASVDHPSVVKSVKYNVLSSLEKASIAIQPIPWKSLRERSF